MPEANLIKVPEYSFSNSLVFIIIHVNQENKKTHFFYQAEQQKNIKFKQQKAQNLSEGKDKNIITRLKSRFENV